MPIVLTLSVLPQSAGQAGRSAAQPHWAAFGDVSGPAVIAADESALGYIRFYLNAV